MAHIQCGRNVLRKLASDRSLTRSRSRSDSIANPMLFIAQGLRFRKLEVILTTSIDKLGKAGETVKVAPGYFRNHLMPKLLAVPNIDKYAYLVREQRKLYQREEEETIQVVAAPTAKEAKIKEYQAAAKRLDNACLVLRRMIKRNVDKSLSLNEVRAPITKEEIIAEVARQLSVNIQPENVYLPSPLATFGQFEVPLLLPKSIPLPVGKVRYTLDVKIRRK
ncbi:hypothetical protein Syun_025249 [Stephania yunnanensis]|uniref:Large ribosomal subunit protein bL9c n=1 Tax=Stephania yunnanensis TaxID=152371 RepID=A0AAP0HUQ8_9MAGN